MSHSRRACPPRSAAASEDAAAGAILRAGAARGSVKAIGISFRESRQKMTASEDAVRDSRQRAADTGGASSEPSVERFEVALDVMT